jgi:hypothetical protein
MLQYICKLRTANEFGWSNFPHVVTKNNLLAAFKHHFRGAGNRKPFFSFCSGLRGVVAGPAHILQVTITN